MTQSGALPFGEIRPGAQPLQAFIAPGRKDSEKPIAFADIPNVKGIVTQQMAGTSSVQGYNNFAEISEALAPFSKSLTSLASKYAVNNATTKIEDAYFDQARLENEVATAKLRYQQIQEKGAKKAAAEALYLEKKDEQAAALLNEANPWKAIGRRRFVAQQAAADIETEMTAELATRGPELQRMEPGSPELAQIKQQVTSRVLEANGLNGSEAESAYYFVPAANKAWDQFTDKQSKLYTSALQASTSARAQGAISSDAVQFMDPNAAPYRLTGADGVTVQFDRNSPEGVQYTADRITAQIDNAQAFMTTSEQRSDFMKQVIKNLGAILTGDTGRAVLNKIKTGPALLKGSKDPNGNPAAIGGPTWKEQLAGRPSLMGQYYAQLQQGNVTTLKSQEDLIQIRENQDERGITQLWNAGPGKLMSRGDRANAIPGFLADVMQKFPNYTGNLANLVENLNGDAQGLSEALNPLAGLGGSEFVSKLRDMPNSAFQNPKTIADLRNQIRDIAEKSENPTTTAKQLNNELDVQINQAEKLQDGVAPWVKQQAFIAMDIDAVRQIKANQKPGQKSSFFDAIRRGDDAATAYNGISPRLSAAANDFQQLLTQYGVAEINNWERENPTIALDPITRQDLLKDALKKAQDDKRWQETLDVLNGKSTTGNGGGGGQPQSQQIDTRGPGAVGVTQTGATGIKADEAKQFESKAVMTMDFVYGEMERLKKNQGFSQSFKDLAKKGGANPYLFLYHQLMFYGNRLDKGGQWRQMLQKSAKQNQASARTIENNVAGMTRQGRVNPSAPGGWVTEMLFA